VDAELQTLVVVDRGAFTAAATLGAVRREAVSVIDPADEPPTAIAAARERQLIGNGGAGRAHDSRPAVRGVTSHPARASARGIE
jgi:hypothetical protein